MLVELIIKDFAIIEGLTITFGPGLNIFTGETGAGKSIIMDALSLILGDRASSEIIRGGREEAQVQAVFDPAKVGGIAAVLEGAGIDQSSELVIKRVVHRSGRNRIYINGAPSTLLTLAEIGRRLIDVCSQSGHETLTREEEHVEVLDSFANLGEERSAMSLSYASYQTIRKELDGVIDGVRESERRRSFLEYELRELTEASVMPGEEEGLKKDYARFRNTDKIAAAVLLSEGGIYSEAGSVTERLGVFVKGLREAAVYDERLNGCVDELGSALLLIEDAGAFLRDFSSKIDLDPETLETVGARIDLINRLKKKYAVEADALADRLARAKAELDGILGADEKIGELKNELSKARENAVKCAALLSEARKHAAQTFKERIEEEVAGLGMKGASFDVRFDVDTDEDGNAVITEKGFERVSFLISANVGEELKPLAKVASGGELSRIMLAIKGVGAAARVPTLVFDEIDTGVGGVTAQAVGVRLKRASAVNQVISITHLPQIAAFADRHFSVRKRVTPDGRTVSIVTELAATERVEEISSMLGGANVTDVTREHARELISGAASLNTGGAATKKKARARCN